MSDLRESIEVSQSGVNLAPLPSIFIVSWEKSRRMGMSQWWVNGKRKVKTWKRERDSSVWSIQFRPICDSWRWCSLAFFQCWNRLLSLFIRSVRGGKSIFLFLSSSRHEEKTRQDEFPCPLAKKSFALNHRLLGKREASDHFSSVCVKKKTNKSLSL